MTFYNSRLITYMSMLTRMRLVRQRWDLRYLPR